MIIGTRVLTGGLLVLCICLFRVPVTTAQTIAVFPLLDLTTGPNGVNYPLSEQVNRIVAEHGFEVIDDQEIMHFMIRHRIRSLGRLTSYQISLLNKELGADIVMIGTVGELKKSPTAAISISLQLIRTSDATILWANTTSLYSSDLITLLGLDDPETMEDLYPVFFSKLFATFPESLPEMPVPENTLDVNTVVLNPKYVRPGDEITCKIKLHSPITKDEDSPLILARVEEREYSLTLEDDGYYYRASWPADEKAGEHRVSLWGRWPDGREKEISIGSYIVDDQAPTVELYLGAKEHDNRLYFNRQLTIIPKLPNPEPITRWEVTVKNEQDEVIVLQSAAQHIPRRLIWNGATNIGAPAPDGEYRIFFKVWDRAGWSGSGETEIMLRRHPPAITLTVEEEEESLAVTLNNQEPTPLNFWWVKFFSRDGHLITTLEDETLPVSVSLYLPGDAEEQRIECLIVAQDIYGNRVERKIEDLLRLAATNEEGEVLKETEWIEEF